MPQGVQRHFPDQGDGGGVDEFGDLLTDEGRADEGVGGAVDDDLARLKAELGQGSAAPQQSLESGSPAEEQERNA